MGLIKTVLSDEKIRKTTLTVERLLLWGGLITIGFFGSISLFQFKEKVKEEIRIERIEEKKSDQEYFGKIIQGMTQQYLELRQETKEHNHEFRVRLNSIEDGMEKNGRDIAELKGRLAARPMMAQKQSEISDEHRPLHPE